MNEPFSRSQFPPGGWEFYQPQTGWKPPTPKSSTFDQTVQLVIRHRLANPAITDKHKLSLDVVAVGNELETYTRLRLGLAPMGAASVPKPMPPPASPSLSEAAQGAVAAVKKIASGAALLLEWEQSGLPPVPAEVAEQRASVCDGCPKNPVEKPFSHFFTEPAAENIKARLSRLHSLNLKTSHDANLNVCTACLCPLPLKVWAPMELILKRLKPEQRAELDPR